MVPLASHPMHLLLAYLWFWIYTSTQKYLDIHCCITQANSACTTMKQVLCNKKTSKIKNTTIQCYSNQHPSKGMWKLGINRRTTKKAWNLSPQISKENGRYHNIWCKRQSYLKSQTNKLERNLLGIKFTNH